jgi:hypothetical protein
MEQSARRFHGLYAALVTTRAPPHFVIPYSIEAHGMVTERTFIRPSPSGSRKGTQQLTLFFLI